MPTQVEIETEELVRKWVPDCDSAVRREHLRRRFESAELEELAAGKLRDMLRDGGFTSPGPRQALVEMLLLPRQSNYAKGILPSHRDEDDELAVSLRHRRTVGEAEGEAGVACDPRSRSRHA